MNTLRLARTAPVLVAVALLTGCGGLPSSWAWKQADLDRNRLNLALYRGADTAAKAAEWVENGTVEDASGSAAIGEDGDLEIVVRYERSHTGWAGGTEEVEQACYRFTSTDGYDVAFAPTLCPRPKS